MHRLVNAFRKKRLALLGPGDGGAPDVAGLRLRVGCACAACDTVVTVGWRQIENDGRVGDGRLRRRLSSTAMAIDLRAYASFEDYRRAVSRETKGKYHRSANKARRLGYSTRPIGRGSHQGGLYAIHASKLYRSKGRVWQAAEGPRADIPDVAAPFSAPACPEHWRLDWGAFLNEDGVERLVGFVSLLRAGNCAIVQHFMGHGDSLTDGVTKLLMFDVMEQALARTEPYLRGIDHLFYGNAEEGAIGLMHWKRYMKFKPVLIACTPPPPAAEPANFDRAAYLELNPDVASAGVDPYKHYLKFGMLEGRRISRD